MSFVLWGRDPLDYCHKSQFRSLCFKKFHEKEGKRQTTETLESPNERRHGNRSRHACKNHCGKIRMEETCQQHMGQVSALRYASKQSNVVWIGLEKGPYIWENVWKLIEHFPKWEQGLNIETMLEPTWFSAFRTSSRLQMEICCPTDLFIHSFISFIFHSFFIHFYYFDYNYHSPSIRLFAYSVNICLFLLRQTS